MTVQSNIEAATLASAMEPFNAYAAYEREREHSRRIETLLSKAVMLLGMECDRREHRGEDVAHIRSFIAEAVE